MSIYEQVSVCDVNFRSHEHSSIQSLEIINRFNVSFMFSWGSQMIILIFMIQVYFITESDRTVGTKGYNSHQLTVMTKVCVCVWVCVWVCVFWAGVSVLQLLPLTELFNLTTCTSCIISEVGKLFLLKSEVNNPEQRNPKNLHHNKYLCVSV